MPKKRTRYTKVAKKRQHHSSPHPGQASSFGPSLIFTEPTVEPFAHPWRIAIILDVDAKTESEAAEKGFDIADAAILSGPEFDVVCCKVGISSVVDDLGPRETSLPTDQGDVVG